MDDIKVNDMYLAAAFLAYGATLVEIDKTDIRRQRFCFRNDIPYVYVMNRSGDIDFKESPDVRDVETWFISKTLIFPPSYPDSIRSIKSVIHSA